MLSEPTRRSVLGGVIGASASGVTATASDIAAPAQVVHSILGQSADKLDYLAAKLAFDCLVDPAVSNVRATTEVDRLVRATRQIAGAATDDRIKLGAVRKAIYDTGPWNDGRPFSYDLQDPLGQVPGSQLLATYLETRRGNCVSMPILFLILADRLDVKGIALAKAPLHYFVRYIDPSGRPFNIETTSGAHATRDAWYRENLPMSDRSIETGAYMRSLTPREATAEMATVLLQHLIFAGQFQDVIDVADAIVEHNPSSIYGLVKRGTAFAGLLEREYVAVYPTPGLIPPPLLQRYEYLVQGNRESFERAEALGWRPDEGQKPTPPPPPASPEPR